MQIIKKREKIHMERDGYSWDYWEPAVGLCDVCGEEVILESSWANECEECGTEYNGCGQRLAPRQFWGEETGELGHWGGYKEEM